jgi:hypothetical protein
METKKKHPALSMTYDELDKSGQLPFLKANFNQHFKALFKEKFGKEYVEPGQAKKGQRKDDLADRVLDLVEAAHRCGAIEANEKPYFMQLAFVDEQNYDTVRALLLNKKEFKSPLARTK